MFWPLIFFLQPRACSRTQRTLSVCKAVLLLGFTAQCAWAQPGSASLESTRKSTEIGATDARLARSVGTASAVKVPAPPVDVVHPAPAPSIEMLAQRIDALTKVFGTISSAARLPVAKPAIVDPWQDTKSIILNIISNRIDSWLFGNGKERVGVAAQFAALLAFIIAIIRLILAVAMLFSSTPITKWGKFKAWIRTSFVVRLINLVIGFLAVAFTGVALYVVISARTAPDLSQASIAALQESLKSCQTTLSKLQQLQPPAAPSPPSSDSRLGTEALQQFREYETAIQTTNTRLKKIEGSVSSIDSKQPWTLTKVIAFLAWTYLLVVVTYLFLKRRGP